MDTRRLILVFVFSLSLVMLWDAWQKYNHPPVPAQIASTAAAIDGSPIPSPSATQPAAASAASVPTSASEQVLAKNESVSIKTDLFVATVSTQGGDIIGLELNKYKSVEDKNKQFSLFEAKHRYMAQSGLIGEGLPNHKTIFTLTNGSRELAPEAKTLQLRLEAPVVDGVKVAKILTFNRGSYLIDVAYEIDNGSQKSVTADAYYQLQRDIESPAGESRTVSTYTGPAVYTESNKYQKISFSDI